MQAGLKVFNEGNVIQIDSTFSNHQLIQKKTVTATNQYFTWGVYAFNAVSAIQPMAVISFDANEPLVAYYSTNMAALMSTQRRGNTWTLTFWCPDWGSVEVFVFDKAKISPSKYGMQVFDESGKLVFDAVNKYARIIDYIYGRVPYQNHGPGSYTSSFSYQRGRKFAVGAVLTPGGWADISYNHDSEFKVYVAYGGWSIADGAVRMSWRQALLRRGNQGGRDPYPAESTGDGMAQYGALVLDVTGY